MAICVVIRNEREAAVMTAFGLRLAAAREERLELWTAYADEGAPSTKPPGVTEICDFSGANRKRQVLEAAKQKNPSLLVVGKTAEAKTGDADLRFSTDLFESLYCQVLAVRVSDELEHEGGKVLVPCAGGRHSRRALKLAQSMAPGGVVAFQVRPRVDDLSEEVGHESLRRIIKRAGLASSGVETRVLLGDDFAALLSEEISREGYGTLIVGASHSGTLRRKLFGTLPERLLNREQGLKVGVIRAERSRGHRMRDFVGRLIQVNVPQLNRNERLALFDEVESKSRWNFDFAALMMLATAIAGMGLLVNSGAVVIGAMLVAPLMMPLIGTGLSLVQGNLPLARQALGAVGRGFCFAFGLSILMGFLARWLDLGLTEQLRMRGEPNSLDLGIAFVSGVAASYCVARPKLTGALAGVAIAAALVPPIATVGISLALGKTTVALGAALLFGTNIVAIVLGSGLNFMLAGISGTHKSGAWGRRSLIALVLVCLGLAVPLTSVLLSRLSRSERLELAVEKELREGMSLVAVSRMRSGGFEVRVESDRPLKESLLEKIADAIEQVEGTREPVRLKTELVQRSE